MDTQQQNVLFSSATAEWGTPDEIVRQIERDWGRKFDLDVCSTHDNAKCRRHYTKEDDCFVKPWDATFWCNPVYGNPEEACPARCKKVRCGKRGYHVDEYQPGCIDFVQRGIQQAKRHGVAGCFLVPARTDVEWWRLLWDNSQMIWFVHGRIPFLLPDGSKLNSAPFPSALVFLDGARQLPRNPACSLWIPE